MLTPTALSIPTIGVKSLRFCRSRASHILDGRYPFLLQLGPHHRGKVHVRFGADIPSDKLGSRGDPLKRLDHLLSHLEAPHANVGTHRREEFGAGAAAPKRCDCPTDDIRHHPAPTAVHGGDCTALLTGQQERQAIRGPHRNRRPRRGRNQAICLGLADAPQLGVPADHHDAIAVDLLSLEQWAGLRVKLPLNVRVPQGETVLEATRFEGWRRKHATNDGGGRLEVHGKVAARVRPNCGEGRVGLASRAMAHKFPSKEWTDAYREAVNANAGYKAAGKDWTHGSVAMVIEADESRGISNPVGMVLDVHQGECRGTQYVEGMDAVADAAFIIVADFGQWREVLEGGLDPTMAMMQNKLKLEKGHLPTMLRFVESSKQLVQSATHVPTDFGS